MTRTLRHFAFALVVGSAVAVPAVPAAAGGGGCRDTAPTEGTGTTVEMTNFCMSPSTLRVAPGTTVTWKNVDPVVHNLFALGWGHGVVEAGASVSQTFADPGTYAYACTLHPGMVGAVVVGDGTGDAAELAAEPVVAVAPETDDDSSSGAGAPLVIGLLGVFLAGGAFVTGARMGRRTPAA